MQLFGGNSPTEALEVVKQLAKAQATSPMPGMHYSNISQVVQKKSLDELRFEQLMTTGIMPKWNGEKDKFFHFEQHILIKRNSTTWSVFTFVTIRSKKIDFTSYPFQVNKQELFQMCTLWTLPKTRIFKYFPYSSRMHWRQILTSSVRGTKFWPAIRWMDVHVDLNCPWYIHQLWHNWWCLAHGDHEHTPKQVFL